VGLAAGAFGWALMIWLASQFFSFSLGIGVVIWVVLVGIMVVADASKNQQKAEAQDSKKCVACAELIKRDARKCKHCGEPQSV